MFWVKDLCQLRELTKGSFWRRTFARNVRPCILFIGRTVTVHQPFYIWICEKNVVSRAKFVLWLFYVLLYVQDNLLFCDTCDKGFHMECLDPPMTDMPSGKITTAGLNEPSLFVHFPRMLTWLSFHRFLGLLHVHFQTIAKKAESHNHTSTPKNPAHAQWFCHVSLGAI